MHRSELNCYVIICLLPPFLFRLNTGPACIFPSAVTVISTELFVRFPGNRVLSDSAV